MAALRDLCWVHLVDACIVDETCDEELQIKDLPLSAMGALDIRWIAFNPHGATIQCNIRQRAVKPSLPSLFALAGSCVMQSNACFFCYAVGGCAEAS
jgi:hypothetical protein